MRTTLFIPILIATVVLMGFLSSQYYASPVLVLGIGAVFIFTICFADPEIGLYIVIFSMLLSPEFGAGEAEAVTGGRGGG